MENILHRNTLGLNLLPFKSTESEILLPDGTMWEIINVTDMLYGRIKLRYPKLIHIKFVGLMSHEDILKI